MKKIGRDSHSRASTVPLLLSVRAFCKQSRVLCTHMSLRSGFSSPNFAVKAFGDVLLCVKQCLDLKQLTTLEVHLHKVKLTNVTMRWRRTIPAPIIIEINTSGRGVSPTLMSHSTDNTVIGTSVACSCSWDSSAHISCLHTSHYLQRQQVQR